jgi:hypothetical protein
MLKRRASRTISTSFPGLLYLQGDASDDDLLEAADIEDARGLFAVTGDDSRNLMIIITARQLNPGLRIVARAQESRNVEKMRKVGADAVISPDFTGGIRLASAMVRPHVVSFLDEMIRSDKNVRVEEVPVPTNFPADAGRRSASAQPGLHSPGLARGGWGLDVQSQGRSRHPVLRQHDHCHGQSFGTCSAQGAPDRE